MSGNPWVRFFPSDWLAGTRGLTCAETGIYISLVAMMYERGGRIKDEPARLARMCGASNSAFKKALETLTSDGAIVAEQGMLWAPVIDRWRIMFGRESLPTATKNAVIARDGYTCSYCGATAGPFHLDHIHPIARGGTDDPENLTVACRDCNLSKGAKTLAEWRGAIQ